MRMVEVFKFENPGWDRHFKKTPDGIAMFHGWGCDYQEFESGAGNFSTAIVERADGTVENVPVELVKFSDRYKEPAFVASKGE